MYSGQLRFWLTILRARARLLYSLDLLWTGHTHHNSCRSLIRSTASRAHIARSLLERRGLHLLSWDPRQQERWISHPEPCSPNNFRQPYISMVSLVVVQYNSSSFLRTSSRYSFMFSPLSLSAFYCISPSCSPSLLSFSVHISSRCSHYYLAFIAISLLSLLYTCFLYYPPVVLIVLQLPSSLLPMATAERTCYPA